MEQKRTPVFRRKFFINKKLQGKFIAGFTLAVFFGLIANLLVSYFLIDRELNEELYKIHIKIRTTSDIAVPILSALGAVMVPSILAVSAATGFFLTRRVELPLLQFRDAIRKRTGGDLSQDLSEDLPPELGPAFAGMTRALEAVFVSLKKSAIILDKESRRLARAQTPGEIRRTLDAITMARERASLEISKLKV